MFVQILINRTSDLVIKSKFFEIFRDFRAKLDGKAAFASLFALSFTIMLLIDGRFFTTPVQHERKSQGLGIIVHFTTRGHLFFKISRFISDVA